MRYYVYMRSYNTSTHVFLWPYRFFTLKEVISQIRYWYAAQSIHSETLYAYLAWPEDTTLDPPYSLDLHDPALTWQVRGE